MKRNYIILGWMLVISGILVGLTGVVLKYAVLEPLGLSRQETSVALPFVYLRDEGLRYVVTEVQGQETTEPVAVQPTQTAPAQIENQERSEQVLFIGDSRTCGLRDYSRIENADYFCDVGMSVFNASKVQLSDEGFNGQGLYDLLSDREYGLVLIGLGLNEAGYPIESLLHAYQELVDRVVKTQPQAVIVLQGVMPVSRSWADRAPYTAPENLNKINDGIRELAQRYRANYLEVDDRFLDEAGFLRDDLTADGCHFYAKYTHLWSEWLMDEVEKLEEK